MSYEKDHFRDETNVYRQIRKMRRRNPSHNGFNTVDADTIYKKMGGFPCRFCSQLMTPHRDWGGDTMWRCWSTNCPNNIDDKLKHVEYARDIDTKYPNNAARKWNDWMPRRIV